MHLHLNRKIVSSRGDEPWRSEHRNHTEQAQSDCGAFTKITALKQRFENLFPGKWINVDERQKTLLTGLPEIDQSLTRGLARQRITEWIGPPSSGKTSTLRAIINHWCAAGFDIAYVDTENQLLASDWTFIEQTSTQRIPALEDLQGKQGKCPASSLFAGSDSLDLPLDMPIVSRKF